MTKARRKKLTSADQIMDLDDLQRETLYVPQWDLDVIVQEMDALTYQDYEPAAGSGEVGIRIRLVAASVVDENGHKIFTIEDVEKLAKKSWNAIQAISDVALKLAKGTPAERQKMLENFQAAQPGDLDSN